MTKNHYCNGQEMNEDYHLSWKQKGIFSDLLKTHTGGIFKIEDGVFVQEHDIYKTLGKFYAAGNIYTGTSDDDGGGYRVNCKTIVIPNIEQLGSYIRIYHAHISLCHVRPAGGEFDTNDYVYCDILGKDMELVNPVGKTEEQYKYENDLKKLDFDHGYGGYTGMGISTYIGEIQNNITFRVVNYGDNYLGASYFVKEIGVIKT